MPDQVSRSSKLTRVVLAVAVLATLIAAGMIYVASALDLSTETTDGLEIYQSFMGQAPPRGVSDLSGSAVFWLEHRGTLIFRVDSDETFQRIIADGFENGAATSQRFPTHPDAPSVPGAKIHTRSRTTDDGWTTRVTLIYDSTQRRVWLAGETSSR